MWQYLTHEIPQGFATPTVSSPLWLFTHPYRHCWQASASFKIAISGWVGLFCFWNQSYFFPVQWIVLSLTRRGYILAGKREEKLPQTQRKFQLKSFLSGKEDLIWVAEIKWQKKTDPLTKSITALLGSLGKLREGGLKGETKQRRLHLMIHAH